MYDREKVIKELEKNAIATNKGYVEIPLFLFSEIIALLKEQEALKPFTDNEGLYWCASCKEDMVWHQKYCSNCGKEVKWE